jgi:rSAM/selenodomain-associated transferase 2/rSAM/selenodomain-associated transferase 1
MGASAYPFAHSAADLGSMPHLNARGRFQEELVFLREYLAMCRRKSTAALQPRSAEGTQLSFSMIQVSVSTSAPTLMVFLKAPRHGGVKKRLAAKLGDERTLDVYRGMAERQLRQVPASWIVEIHYTPDDAESEMKAWLGPSYTYVPQSGNDLGERLTNAFRRAFDAGHKEVMAIGGDCPELDTDTLWEASRRMVRADLVLGPAEDGGYYLIGLRRLVPELFKDIPWSTPHVLSLTMARGKISGLSRELLAPKEDIDDLPSYERYLRRVAHQSAGDSLAVIVPTLNEAQRVSAALLSVRQSFPGSPVIVVDGGSSDGTREIAERYGGKVLATEAGRGAQCRAGASSLPDADWLLFLHADTVLPVNAHALVNEFIAESHAQVATFRARFDEPNWFLRICGWCTRFDSVFTRFGDQAILIRREFYEALGGFPEWPLFEDVALLQRARAVTKVHSLKGWVTTSARRFKDKGAIAQQWANGRLLVRYLRGVPARELAESYPPSRSADSRSPTTTTISECRVSPVP